MSGVFAYCPQCRSRRWMRSVSLHGKSLPVLLPARDGALREALGELPTRFPTTHDLELLTGERLTFLECEDCLAAGRRLAWCRVPGQDQLFAVILPPTETPRYD